MADFIANSACNGCKPKHLEGTTHYLRTELLAKMMRDRHVARFLIAPTLFGKTAVALEYADSIFDFENVFWFNAQSPCFLRDIDKGTFAKTLFSKTKTPSLVVFEDMPRLNVERLEGVSLCIDMLLDNGWEVVVSMNPGCDALADRQPDGIRLVTQDFLASDDEVRQVIDSKQESHRTPRSYTPADRIPGILWAGKKGRLGLLEKLCKDTMPTDALLGIFVMLVLSEGTLDDVEVFAGALKSDTRTLLERDYVFMGIDRQSNHFDALFCTVDEIASSFTSALGRIAACSLFGDTEALVAHLADVLVERRNCERACTLIKVFSSAEHRMIWLEAQGHALFRAGCLLVPERIFESRPIRVTAQTAQIAVDQAYRLFALDDRDGGLLLSESVMELGNAPDEARALAAILISRYGSGRRPGVADDRLRGLMYAQLHDSDILCSVSVVEAMRACGPWWVALAAGHLGIHKQESDLCDLLEVLFATKTPDALTSCLIAWTLEEIGEGYKDGLTKEVQKKEDRALANGAEYLSRLEASGHFDMIDSTLLNAWDAAILLCDGEAESLTVSTLRTQAAALESSMLAQRNAFARVRRETQSQRQSYPERYNVLRRTNEVKVKQRIPSLHVCLLGGLEVSIDGNELDPRLLRRQSVKTLLAILVLNQGKELLRERLSELLWPESSGETAQRNFYSTWSMLRKALRTPEGDCPYLLRLQHSCKLDTHAVTSDLATIDALCRRFLFETHGKETWSSLFEQVNELYRGDLLPSENHNEYILRMRDEYRGRLVDAFVAVAGSLLAQKELQASLWFARAALRRDDTREDAYTILMRAQMAVGQRTAALDTYFKCKRYLADELGIDPSIQAKALYNTIITDEPGLESFVPALG